MIVMKLEVFSLTFQKHLIKSGTMVLYSNYKKMEYKVVLNGQSSLWTTVEAGVPQDSILGPMLFLININNLADGLSSNTKLFADDTSLFSVIHDSVIMTSELNSDIARIKHWAFQWKMSFNSDRNKQAQEVIFSRKLKKVCHMFQQE